MATWHQQKARSRDGVKLFDRIKWNVVTDQPGELCTVMSFVDQVQATEYLFRLRSTQKTKADHSFILPPSQK